MQVQVDHVAELGQQPSKSPSARNLQLSLSDENTIVLNQLHAQDPFLDDLRMTWGGRTSRAGRLRSRPDYRGPNPHKALLPDPATPGASPAEAARAAEAAGIMADFIDELEPGDVF